VSDWRRRVEAKSEEDGGKVMLHFRPGWRPLRHWLSAEDLKRVAAGMACWNCLQPFPAPVGAENVKVWKREAPEAFDWHSTIPPSFYEQRVKDSCCPYCDCECTPEMIRAQIDPTPGGPQRPGGPNYITDADRDAEAKRHAIVEEATRRA
jgi:hypothetical protein